jgi:hypothetical protein
MNGALPSSEQEARAKWDLLVADYERRLDQIQRVKHELRLAPWQLAAAGFSACVAWVTVIFVIAELLRS